MRSSSINPALAVKIPVLQPPERLQSENRLLAQAPGAQTTASPSSRSSCENTQTFLGFEGKKKDVVKLWFGSQRFQLSGRLL